MTETNRQPRSPEPRWVPEPTQDGSFTFFSSEFGEAFHSRWGAKAEAVAKFAQATALAAQAQRGQLCLLDVCYGLGYNTAAALETVWSANPRCQVTLYGLELDPSVPLAAIAPDLLQVWSPPVRPLLHAIATTHQCQTPLIAARLLLGDARQTLPTLAIAADAIFLDPFSPRRCPQLWTVEFMTLLARCLAPTGKLATYSRAAAVRRALRLAGLQIGSLPLTEAHLPHEWSQGTIAAHTDQDLWPLSPLETEHLQTRAAVPYRDPDLCDTAAAILERQRQEQQQFRGESTSQWRRRWGIE